MSSIIPRVAARQANKFPKPNNPFMSVQTEAQPPQSDHVNPLLKPEMVEAAQPEKDSEFSITKFFRMSWTQRFSSENESLDQMLIRNIRALMEEERERQMAFERMCGTRLNC
ncbi:hypothetical protein ANCCAN_01277 [Ancylostoma caninum]|uniref:Uncharacterized protein n=1 Tax=Ancylostoma caninum TaxID=29170 RepID=A0A368HA35_ANCCA|nr:hypothetical protein ANCCAN_01277 [Ancylostoma caninum]